MLTGSRSGWRLVHVSCPRFETGLFWDVSLCAGRVVRRPRQGPAGLDGHGGLRCCSAEHRAGRQGSCECWCALQHDRRTHGLAAPTPARCCLCVVPLLAWRVVYQGGARRPCHQPVPATWRAVQQNSWRPACGRGFTRTHALFVLSCPAQDDAAAAHWFPVEEPPSLAFDHKLIVREALATLTQRPEVKDNGEPTRGVGGYSRGVLHADMDHPPFILSADTAPPQPPRLTV